jgi:hypothetical protein
VLADARGDALLFQGYVREGEVSRSVVFRTRGSRVQRVAADGDPILGGGALAGVSPLALGQKGRVVLAGTVVYADSTSAPGIFVARRGTIRAVVRGGDPIDVGTFVGANQQVMSADNRAVVLTAPLGAGSPREALLVYDRLR